ncbi:antitoxin Xre-like helix-turn-helix domain-containing protein [Tunturiibacter psychrotolerans]|uniref:antitoxin Xre-like helix-turn-helix domain-containing protein n=1 Tax=Tunturiibacter psychrotolerans TaxID=3069686 RepID=UPI003D257D9B
MASTAVLSDVPGYQTPTIPDLRDPATRAELSKGALIGFFAIVSSWKLSMSQAAELLDKSRSNLYKLKENPEAGSLSRDELTRISYIIGINRALHVAFPEKLACEWMTRPNNNSLFRGETPFAYVAQEGIPALHQVRMMLDAARAGN